MNRTVQAITLLASCIASACAAQVAVKAATLHTMAGEPISNAVVVINAQGIITAVGPAATTPIPNGHTIYECAVATPGLVDVRATVGLTGIYNVDHDQDVLETSAPIQPELRAFDAYNPREPLVGYLRSLGITTAHVGHAPGKLITGQTSIVKTRGDTISDAVFDAETTSDFAVTATLGPSATEGGGKSPGTRGKQVSMLRQELLKAQEFAAKRDAPQADESEDGESASPPSPPARNLRLEALADVLSGDKPLIITANKSQDIASALRLAEEFGITVWIDSAAEAYALADEIAASGSPVLLHPTSMRYYGETANGSFITAGKLAEAGVPFAIQSGYEAYVPKVRVVLFEAAVAAGQGGLGFDEALRRVTIEPAKILGIDDRVGSIEVGKHGDIAMYTADPFEYTTHCTGTLIEGEFFVGEREYVIGYPGGSPRQR